MGDVANYLHEEVEASSAPVRVVVCGATGAAGRRLIPALATRSDFILVGAVGRRGAGEDVGRVLGGHEVGVCVTEDVRQVLSDVECQVLVDFTAPGAAVDHCQAAMDVGASVLIGTTGIDPNEISRLGNVAADRNVAVFLAPNMTLSAQLVLRCAELVRPYFGDVEIIEVHQPSKLDAPSGTSIETAQRLNRCSAPPATLDQTAVGRLESRGTRIGQVQIHSVRLPGVYDRQEVLFSRPDELLTLRFDQFSALPLVEPTLRAIRLLPGQPGGLLRELPGLFD